MLFSAGPSRLAMEHSQDSNGRVLRPEASTLSDVSMMSSSTFVASPSSPSPPNSVHHRPSYQRVPTLQEQDISYHGAKDMDEDTGLRIQNMKGTTQGPSIEISYRGESSPAVPGSAGNMLSPSLSRSSKKQYKALEDTPEEETEAAFYPGGRATSDSIYRPFTADSETETLRRARRSSRSTLSPYGPTGMTFSVDVSKSISRILLSSLVTRKILVHHMAFVCSVPFPGTWTSIDTAKLKQLADIHFSQAENIQTSHAQPNSTSTTVAAMYPLSLFLSLLYFPPFSPGFGSGSGLENRIMAKPLRIAVGCHLAQLRYSWQRLQRLSS